MVVLHFAVVCHHDTNVIAVLIILLLCPCWQHSLVLSEEGPASLCCFCSLEYPANRNNKQWDRSKTIWRWTVLSIPFPDSYVLQGLGGNRWNEFIWFACSDTNTHIPTWAPFCLDAWEQRMMSTLRHSAILPCSRALGDFISQYEWINKWL